MNIEKLLGYTTSYNIVRWKRTARNYMVMVR